MIAALSAIFAATVFAAPESAMRRALDADADWSLERRLGGSAMVFKSSGIVRCRKGEGIEWKTTSPFESSVTMTRSSMIFEDEDGRRVKNLSELSHYEEIREATDRFANGDRSAFDGVFELKCEELPDGGWRLKLVPAVAAMRTLISEVVLSGAALPTNAVLKTADGGISRIAFKERKRE